jgi:hypothetical protein
MQQLSMRLKALISCPCSIHKKNSAHDKHAHSHAQHALKRIFFMKHIKTFEIIDFRFQFRSLYPDGL